MPASRVVPVRAGMGGKSTTPQPGSTALTARGLKRQAGAAGCGRACAHQSWCGERPGLATGRGSDFSEASPLDGRLAIHYVRRLSTGFCDGDHLVATRYIDL